MRSVGKLAALAVLVLAAAVTIGPFEPAAAAPTATITTFGSGEPNSPTSIVSGGDGNLWYLNSGDNTIGRVTPAGVFTTFDPDAGFVTSLTAGPDGNVWFVGGHQGPKIGRITPAGVVTLFGDPNLRSASALTAGPDNNLWFVDSGGTGRIGRITPTGVFTFFSSPSLRLVTDITAGPDGNLWFANDSLSIGRITPTGTITIFDGASDPYSIAAGPDGTLWYWHGYDVHRMSTSGVNLGLFVRAPHNELTPGPDGQMWFTNYDSVGRISVTGNVDIFPPDPTKIAGAIGITTGPDNNIWFTNADHNTIARLSDVQPGPPDAPRDPGATPGDGSAGVNWVVPQGNGGSPITSYIVTASPGGQTCTWTTGPLTCTVTGLTNGVTYTFTVTASNAVGTSGPSEPTSAVTPLPPSRYVALAPRRLVDTRETMPEKYVNVTVKGGSTGVPTDATAVAVNVTGVFPTEATHLTVYPTGEDVPDASNINLPPGAVRPNLVVVKIGTNGQISIVNKSGTTNVVVDLVGYYSPDLGGGLFTPLSGKRVLDSRDGIGGFDTPWGAGTSRTVAVTGGSTTVPANATAVVLNMTVTGATTASHLTVWPDGSMPLASNLNFLPGETVANLVVVKVGAGGTVSVFNNAGNAHVIADVVGYYSDSGVMFTPVSPKRVADTRGGTPYGDWSPLFPGEAREFPMTGGTSTVPPDAKAVVVNVTAVNPSEATHLTAWPAGEFMPMSSNLNLPAHDIRANLAVVKVGLAGKIEMYNNTGYTFVIADVVGFYT